MCNVFSFAKFFFFTAIKFENVTSGKLRLPALFSGEICKYFREGESGKISLVDSRYRGTVFGMTIGAEGATEDDGRTHTSPKAFWEQKPAACVVSRPKPPSSLKGSSKGGFRKGMAQDTDGIG